MWLLLAVGCASSGGQQQKLGCEFTTFELVDGATTDAGFTSAEALAAADRMASLDASLRYGDYPPGSADWTPATVSFRTDEWLYQRGAWQGDPPRGFDTAPECGDHVSVLGVLSFETEDGAFAESAESVLLFADDVEDFGYHAAWTDDSLRGTWQPPADAGDWESFTVALSGRVYADGLDDGEVRAYVDSDPDFEAVIGTWH